MPEKMPLHTIEVEQLPDGYLKASTAEIKVDGYHQPAVTLERRKPRRQLTPEQRAANVERLRRANEARQQNREEQVPSKPAATVTKE